MIVPALRRAFTLARNGRPGPCLVEVCDVFRHGHPVDHDAGRSRLRADQADADRRRMPKAIDAAAEALLKAKMPLIYAGQGVHYAKAWPELRQVAELLEAPVGTSMEGKSAFPETHALSLGRRRQHDVACAGDSRARVGRGLRRRRQLQPGLFDPVADGRQALHPQHHRRARSQQDHSDRTIPSSATAKLTLAMLHQALSERLRGKPRGLAREVAARIQEQNRPVARRAGCRS